MREEMHKAVRYFAKATLHFIRFCVYPIVVAFSFLLFAFTIATWFVTPSEVNSITILQASFLFAVILSSPILVVYTVKGIFDLADKSEKVTTFFHKHSPKIREKLPIESRLVLKRYLLYLSISMFLLTIALLIRSIPNIPVSLFSLDLWSWFGAYVLAGFLLQGYQGAYTEEERALFFLKEFNRDVKRYIENDDTQPDVQSFEKVLKSHQRTMPSYCGFKNWKLKVRQIQIVLERGSKKDISQLQVFLNDLLKSVEDNNNSSLDKHFAEMVRFLEDFEKEKSAVIEISILSKKEKMKTSLQQLLKPVLNKVIPYIILAALGLAMSMILGIKLTNLPS